MSDLRIKSDKAHDQARAITPNKFAKGDEVLRKGELCTVMKVHYEDEPISYTIKVNGTSRIIGTLESYLSFPHSESEESDQSKDTDSLHEEEDSESVSLEENETDSSSESEEESSDFEENAPQSQIPVQERPERRYVDPRMYRRELPHRRIPDGYYEARRDPQRRAPRDHYRARHAPAHAQRRTAHPFFERPRPRQHYDFFERPQRHHPFFSSPIFSF